ncbi:hypothetical protein BC826DRAFT_655111 [Russula brevipes]|nr:hypothetical protein BC826DRAFT_655111 [Russula brevipes]
MPRLTRSHLPPVRFVLAVPLPFLLLSLTLLSPSSTAFSRTLPPVLLCVRFPYLYRIRRFFSLLPCMFYRSLFFHLRFFRFPASLFLYCPPSALRFSFRLLFRAVAAQ